jgi:hypothetical protein
MFNRVSPMTWQATPMRARVPVSIGLLLLLLATHVAIGTQAFTAPGLYLDTIFPDYLAVRIVDPSSPTDIWMWPGNLVWDRFPLFSGAPYLGNLPAYLTVPFYLAFGGTLLSIRLAHLFLALVIIAVSFETVRGATRSIVLTAVSTLALATDPGFTFAFRTQAHVTTFAVAFAILGLYLLAKDNSSLGKYVAAGFCLGFSLWGYFVYAFLCPGILIFVLTSRAGRKCDTWRTIWKRVYTRSRALLCQLHPSGRLAGGTNQNLALC